MDFVFLYDLLNVNWTHAIATTLLHSIWEGTLAAILSGIIILCAKKCRASVRYFLHALVFLFFLVAVTYTFIREIENDLIHPGTALSSVDTSPLLAGEVVMSNAGYNGMNTSFVVLRINYFLSKYSTVIVFAWLVIFFMRSCFIIVGIHRIQRLRKQESRDAPRNWKHKLDILACKIGITKHLLLLESERISVPMVIGYFKPAIIIPIGLICRLPIQEMEAILLHELAHIRRRDYLVNLLQSIAENIFFFHPCILWISSLIREERENCCDDIVVQVTNDREQYIHALISFQEYNIAASAAPAIAFAGTRHRLLDRVRRLLNHENKKLNQMEKMILIGSMVVLTSICLISTNDSQAQQRERPYRESFKREQPRSGIREDFKEREFSVNDPELRHISTNTTVNDGDRVTTITAVDEEGRKYKLKNINGRIESLFIDGEEIDEDDFDEYRDIIKRIEGVSAAAREKVILQRQKAQEKRNESEAIRELRVEEQRRRELEMTHRNNRNRAEAEKRVYKLREKENDSRNRERLEGEEAHLGGQERLRELLETQVEINRNRNRHRDQNTDVDIEKIKPKLKEGQSRAYEHQLLERELMQRAEEDAGRSKMEQHRVQEMLARTRDMQQKNAERMAEQRKLQHKRYLDQMERNRDIQERNRERMLEQRKAQQELYREQLDRQREALQLRYHADPLKKPKTYVFKPKPKNVIERRHNTREDEIAGIIEILEEEEIIDSRERISFTLTEDNFIVNGRRQSTDLHERLKDRFIEKSGDHISYFKDGNTTRTTIQRN